jgi:hypothetical protein
MDAFKPLADWMNSKQQHVIEYLQEEIRVLEEQQGDGRPRFAVSRGDAWRARPSRSDYREAA